MPDTNEAARISEDDLTALRESIADALAEEAGSLAVHAHIDGARALDAPLWRMSGELGWMAIALPEEFGGFGMGAAGSAVINTELGRVCAPGPFVSTIVGAQTIAEYGADLRPEWLPRILAGEISIAIPAILSGKGAQSAALKDGAVSGQFTMVGAEDAAIALLPVDTKKLAVIELAGAQFEAQDFWDRTRSIQQVTLTQVAPLALLPAEAVTLLERDFALALAADSLGTARAIIAKTIEYMKEREQFGRPIASFQALKHRVVDLVLRAEVAEHIIDHAIETALSGDPSANMWAALAKADASDGAAEIAGDCTQLHGGVGYTWEYDVHIHMKRARLNQMLVADNRHLRDRAADDLARLTRAGTSVLEIAAA